MAAASEQPEAPPSFVKLAGHPVRWRLLAELADGDRRVGELCEMLGQPQSLVSYHLARLRSEALVFRRRSSADGRDSYYGLDLERCGDLLAATGLALHPGLRLERPPLQADALGRRAVSLLFMCTGNSARSQIAEALARHLSDGAVEVASAGSHPKPVHREARRVLAERGIDIGGATSTPVEQFTNRHFDYVVTLCDRVREVCPEFPGHPDRIHWSIPDPARSGGNHQNALRAFRRTLAELECRVDFLLRRITIDAGSI